MSSFVCLCYRTHRQCKCELCEIQRGLLCQHRDKLHSQSEPRDPRNFREGNVISYVQ